MRTAGFDHLIGDVLQGTYRIERMVGKGGMGAVFEASHLRLKRRFAIKVLVPELAEMPEALARFKREAEITSAIGHPNILEVIDFNHDHEGLPYIVMELLSGEPLSERIKRRGQLLLDEVAVIFRQLASALQAAHDQGVVHRDLKPQNISLCMRSDTDTFVKVFDFGISKVLGAKTELTRSRSALGTPHYMSPEQAEEDSASVDRRTDVFSVGVILYELLTGQLPFMGDKTLAVLFKIVNKPHRPVQELRAEVPAALGAVIDRALAKRREERFASMSDFWRGYAEAMGCEDRELRTTGVREKIALTIRGVETATTFDASGPLDLEAGDSSARVTSTEALSRRLSLRRFVVPASLALLLALGAAGYVVKTRGGQGDQAAGTTPSVTTAAAEAVEEDAGTPPAPNSRRVAATAESDAGRASIPDAASASRSITDAATRGVTRSRTRPRRVRAAGWASRDEPTPASAAKKSPSVKKPAAKQPAAKQPAAKQPAAKKDQPQPSRHIGKQTMGW